MCIGVELSRAEPSRTEPSRAEPSRAGTIRRGSTEPITGRAELNWLPRRAEPIQAEPSRALLSIIMEREGGKEPRSGCVPLRRGVGEEGRGGRNPATTTTTATKATTFCDDGGLNFHPHEQMSQHQPTYFSLLKP